MSDKQKRYHFERQPRSVIKQNDILNIYAIIITVKHFIKDES